MLCLDPNKAFDKEVRETLIEVRSGDNIEHHLVGHGLTSAAAKHMATCTSESGGLRRELGVPDVIAEMVADLHDARAACSVPCCSICSTGVLLRELREALASSGLLTPCHTQKACFSVVACL